MMRKATTNDWLDDGGWYLLLPQRLLRSWHGTDSDDYDRFCAASDCWLNQLSVGDGFGLALGGDPGMILVVSQRDGGTVLIRWHYGDREEELIAFALKGHHVQRTEPDVVFENNDSSWLLFNAAGNPSVDNSPRRMVPFPPGRVRIRTTFLEDGHNSAIVHVIDPA